jgi:hypothetical protein
MNGFELGGRALKVAWASNPTTTGGGEMPSMPMHHQQHPPSAQEVREAAVKMALDKIKVKENEWGGGRTGEAIMFPGMSSAMVCLKEDIIDPVPRLGADGA